MDRYVGTLLGGISAEIIGNEVEGLSRKLVRVIFPDGIHMPELREYTDDGQMTLVLARHLTDQGLPRIDARQLHYEYAEEYDRNQKKYGSGTFRMLVTVKNSPTLLVGSSYGNGSVMRISPLALATSMTTNDFTLVELVQEAVYCTHNSEESISMSPRRQM
jgi:ADP-ribosylglycohydrolase